MTWDVIPSMTRFVCDRCGEKKTQATDRKILPEGWHRMPPLVLLPDNERRPLAGPDNDLDDNHLCKTCTEDFHSFMGPK